MNVGTMVINIPVQLLPPSPILNDGTKLKTYGQLAYDSEIILLHLCNRFNILSTSRVISISIYPIKALLHEKYHTSLSLVSDNFFVDKLQQHQQGNTIIKLKFFQTEFQHHQWPLDKHSDRILKLLLSHTTSSNILFEFDVQSYLNDSMLEYLAMTRHVQRFDFYVGDKYRSRIHDKMFERLADIMTKHCNTMTSLSLDDRVFVERIQPQLHLFTSLDSISITRTRLINLIGLYQLANNPLSNLRSLTFLEAHEVAEELKEFLNNVSLEHLNIHRLELTDMTPIKTSKVLALDQFETINIMSFSDSSIEYPCVIGQRLRHFVVPNRCMKHLDLSSTNGQSLETLTLHGWTDDIEDYDRLAAFLDNHPRLLSLNVEIHCCEPLPNIIDVFNC
ncbi:hypothetical protein SAMD00019534_059780 [Acytostelium subglobosum LB1]|uniref:hypothetical protein n=1 Tax=Acytostelium subglobosum LB1 TaxID=1410327 RepID=UPI0006450C7A|nr:hypothetical protein SAMD00019534_059780 [Acytostelium subglobosum LB1]GAM22803.1 hypothetical protein SAMD00019534_059780 [Acytostelium subglobosum LB1]|eukprot:XP_012754030.1 hypothetical protein SAMD00019534_059780 [Acytostelium subglobosum LB1]